MLRDTPLVESVVLADCSSTSSNAGFAPSTNQSANKLCPVSSERPPASPKHTYSTDITPLSVADTQSSGEPTSHQVGQSQQSQQNTHTQHVHQQPASVVTLSTLPPSICRDFLRGVCRRGKHCKYQHVNIGVASVATCGDPDVISLGGELPAGAQSQSSRRLDCLCRDYLKGVCVRGQSCMYRHVNARHWERLLHERAVDVVTRASVQQQPADLLVPVDTSGAVGGAVTVPDSVSFVQLLDETQCRTVQQQQQAGFVCARQTFSADPPPQDTQLPSKRRHIDLTGAPPSVTVYPGGAAPGVVRARGAVHDYRTHSPLTELDYRIIEDDNRLLMREVQQLKKQVENLHTTNEFLLDQNAQLRMSCKSPAVPVSRLATMTVSAASLAASSAAAAAPLTVTPLPQSLVATAHNAQVVTVADNITAAVPVPISVNPGTATLAVSLAPVSMQQQPTLPASFQHTQINGPVAVACSVSGGSMVSYPIVSQTFRPILSSSLAPH